MGSHNTKQVAPSLMAGMATLCGGISAATIVVNRNYDWGYGFLLLGFFSLILALGAMKRSEVSTEVAIAYIVRLAMCFVCILQNDGDADNYAVYAIKYAAMPLNQVLVNIPTGAYLYSWVISFLFRFLGEYFTPVRVMNMAISVWCVYIVIDIIDEIYQNRNTTRKAAMWMAVFPNLIRFSSYFANREPMLMLFMLLYLKHSYRYYKNNRFQSLVKSVLFLIPAMILHTSMLAMIALTVFIILSRESYSANKASALLGKIIVTVGMIGVFFVIIKSGVGTEKFSIGGGVELNVTSISNIGNMSAAGRAAYLKGINFSNPLLTVLFLPVRMLYFLYTPFVWMLRSLVDMVGLFDAILYIYISHKIYLKIYNLKNKYKTSQEKFIMLLFFVLVVVIAMFAAVTSNYGTAIRHRCKLFPLMLIIVADTIGKKEEKNALQN